MSYPPVHLDVFDMVAATVRYHHHLGGPEWKHEHDLTCVSKENEDVKDSRDLTVMHIVQTSAFRNLPNLLR